MGREKKEISIIRCLRKNSRAKLWEIGDNLGMPTTTVFENLKRAEEYIIKKTSLIDFSHVKHPLSVIYALKMEDEDRKKLIKILKTYPYTNNIFRISGPYNLLIECIFRDLKKAYEFKEILESYSPKKVIEYQLIEELKKEEFLT